jgi:hypothetical protein
VPVKSYNPHRSDSAQMVRVVIVVKVIIFKMLIPRISDQLRNTGLIFLIALRSDLNLDSNKYSKMLIKLFLAL